MEIFSQNIVKIVPFREIRYEMLKEIKKNMYSLRFLKCSENVNKYLFVHFLGRQLRVKKNAELSVKGGGVNPLSATLGSFYPSP